MHTFGGWTGDKVTPECLFDKQGAEQYLKNLRAYVYISEQRFEQASFNEETIKWQSSFYTQQLDCKNPSYLSG